MSTGGRALFGSQLCADQEGPFRRGMVSAWGSFQSEASHPMPEEQILPPSIWGLGLSVAGRPWGFSALGVESRSLPRACSGSKVRLPKATGPGEVSHLPKETAESYFSGAVFG